MSQTGVRQASRLLPPLNSGQDGGLGPRALTWTKLPRIRDCGERGNSHPGASRPCSTLASLEGLDPAGSVGVHGRWRKLVLMSPPTSLSRRSTLRIGLGLAFASGGTSSFAARRAGDYLVPAASDEAIRRAIASGAARLILPAGRIFLNQTLRVPSGTALIGAGADRTMFEASDAIGPGEAVIESGGTGVVLTNFSVDGRGGAGHGVQLSGSGHHLSGLSVRDVAQAGYRLTISESDIEDCVAIDCGRSGHSDNHGFMLYTTSREGQGSLRGTAFRRCRVENAFRKGFALYTDGPEVSNILFEGCEARGCGLPLQSGGGFYLVPAQRRRMAGVTVRNCHAEDNYVNYEIGPVDGLMVSGCGSGNARATGFLIHGSQDFEIVGNRDEGSGVDAMRFDDVLGISDDGRIANNVLTDANQSVAGFASYINLEGAERTLVTGNTFVDTEARTPFGVYEGRRRGRNDVRDNRRAKLR